MNTQERPSSSAQNAAIHIQVLTQYIKDLSFENPNVGKHVIKQGENPELTLEINVEAQKVNTDIYESKILFSAKPKHSGGTIYILEMTYGGLFKIQNIPEQALEPFLLINCPALLFPFLRRIVADVSRDGGYAPLWLDPIDFGSLYVQRQQKLAQNAEKQ